MGSYAGLTPSSAFLARIQRGELGGVILFGDNITTVAALRATVATLQAAAARGGNPPLLIATDQEGGDVKRLPVGPPPASAETMGATDGSKAARRGSEAPPGVYLRKAGIDVDLAPVLDVGNAATIVSRQPDLQLEPGDRREPRVELRDRSSGCTSGRNGQAFPGHSGPHRGTPTHTPSSSPRPARSSTRRLASFRAAIRAGVKLVMVSNASYKAHSIRRGSRRRLSPLIVGKLLRTELGFSGVVITDTMSAPGPRCILRTHRSGH